MLSPSVVVLERRSGIAALKRSKQLGDGSHWRNSGLVLLISIIMALIGSVIGGVFGFVFPHLLNHWIFRMVLISVQQGLAMPIMLTSLVLLYYDRRVRNEGYDAKALAEDLAR
jgi:predicted lysophospholipase L1 biosynthesis ABC-type transport system permease subunit